MVEKKKKKLTIKRVEQITGKSAGTCRECKYNVNGFCVLRGAWAVVGCSKFERGVPDINTIADAYYKAKQLLDEYKTRVDAIRKQIIDWFGEGKFLAGKYIIEIEKRKRKIINTKKLKEMFEVPEELIRETEYHVVTIKTLEVKNAYGIPTEPELTLFEQLGKKKSKNTNSNTTNEGNEP